MTITHELAEILSEVNRPGDYFVFGRADFPAPRLEVEGVGPIALPLLDAQAAQLIKMATRAPYGRGSDTLIDTNVRRTWQIEADRVRIAGKHWSGTLDGIVARATEGLGLTEPVTAELYKLLVYDTGSFFVSHRDTEKAPGMFATLVLALPSQSEGGELVVRHKDREVRLDLRCDEPSEIAFAAFYADCVHEVLPVTAGCRAALVFNLIRSGKGAAPEPPAYEAEAAQVVALLDVWAKADAPPDPETDDIDDEENIDRAPAKLVYPLEHAYTPAELEFDKLKGVDAAVARLLTAAAPAAGCDLHLALLTVWESGSAQYNGDYRPRYRRSRCDDDEDEDGADSEDFEVIEVVDWERSLTEWRRPDGAPTTLGKLPFEDGEVVPPDALEDMEPDEEEFHEATGNEGASFDRTYARAALVLWPASRILVVLNQAGLEATLPYLDELTAKWQAAGRAIESPVRARALELAGHMLTTWPKRTWYKHEGNRTEPSHIRRMLGLLARLDEKSLVAAMIGKLITQGGHDKADNEAILEAVGIFPRDQAAELLQTIVAANAIDALGGCGALLAGALKGPFAKQPAKLIGAVQTLLDALPGDPASAPKDQWGRPKASRVDAAFVVDIAGVVDGVDGALAERAAAHLMAWPLHFDLDTVLVPASKQLLDSQRIGVSGPASKALHAASVAHLQSRIAETLEPPKDWSRPSRLGCQCAHCADLAKFLADPARESWTLKAAQHARSHVEDTIHRARPDVDARTERRGSPHSLICRKNQASHQRRVAQRKQDLADIAVLRG
jgi:predicted 2-oxoglutarate/Fe(II)-dependent dioxygenase YbiX